MGCRNGTCAITNLPIFAGEEVVVFFLEESRFMLDNYCYPITYNTLSPFHFYGEYNDYGAVENTHGEYRDVLINNIRERLVEFEQGKNQYHDIPVKKSELNEETIFEYDHKNRLYLKSTGNAKLLRLTHITIRKSVFDEFLKKYKHEFYINKSSGYNTKSMNFEQWIKYELDLFKKNENELLNSSKEKSEILKSCSSYSVLRFHKDSVIPDFLHRSEFRSCSVNMPKFVHDNDIFDNNEKFEKFLRNVLPTYLMDCMFTKARKRFIRPSGVGSQESSTDAQLLFDTLTKNGAKEIKKLEEEDEI